jgi:mannose-1-phosphate guanylyltransferase/mannose-6-phosphate isomerase
VLPADHVVLDPDAFVVAVGAAVDAATQGYLTTFGVVPDAPETGFGYIRRGEVRGAWAVVEEFVEKPSLDVANEYLRSGRYLWNSGMFLFSVDVLLRELELRAGDLSTACKRAVAEANSVGNVVRLGAAFRECPSISIDVAVMEKTDCAAVVPLDAGWSDVGSWPALHTVLPKDSAGNVLVGNVVADSCEDSYVAANSRLVVAVGLEGIVVVETADAVLIMSRDKAQNLKGVVDALTLRDTVDGRKTRETGA